MAEQTPQPLDPDAQDGEIEIEILEVIGLDPDAPGSTAEAPPEPPPDSRPPAADAAQTGDGTMSDRERLMRLSADFEAYRQRVERQRQRREAEAVGDLVGRLLPVLDNFERALAVGSSPDNDESLREGVQLIFRHFLDELRKVGLEPIEAVGEPFDPHLHDAVETEIDPTLPANQIVEELLRGYRFRDQLLRPARVRVVIHADPGRTDPEA